GGLSQYATTEQTFTAPGLYPYACILHPGMVGVVVVGDGKFVAAGTTQDVKASIAQPVASAGTATAKLAPPNSTHDRPVWLYVGLGALAGVVVASAATGVVFARR
ncbi:MAG: hypothetical protein ABIP13_03140, partial [Tepidiformaceae bacterium]